MKIVIQNNRQILFPDDGKRIYDTKTKFIFKKVKTLIDADISRYIEIEDVIPEIPPVPIFIIEDNIELTELKSKLIAYSKIKLNEFLDNNPVSFEGKLYAVTSDTQSHLDTLILAAEDARQLNISFTPMWNDVNGHREPWELNKLKQLRITIQQYILQLVIQQQQIEKMILQAANEIQAYNINIGYHI